ncbi:unnamed protein product [Fusarium langsethiae]|nr:unnamed protein product [Fusarium langsethiae]
MKFQNILLGYVLLHSTQALSLPDDVYSSLITRTNSKKPLEWSRCNFDFGTQAANETQKGFDCARLEVPIDYTNSSNTKTFQLDLMRLNATKKPHNGSVLFNPGGPGFSTLENMLVNGPKLLSITGGQYDIIGFDTRGTGRTIPFNCPDTTAGENATDLNRRDFNTLPRLNTWELMKTLGWKSRGEIAESCWKANRETGQFYGTTAIARDMMSIVDALDQGDKLNYWGISYGTVLGQVVASMFPERVGRIVLDGNLNADDYAASTWLSSLIDTERSLANLFDDCVKSGKDECSLADFHGKNTTGESLMKAFKEKLEVAFAATASEEEQGEAYVLKQNIFNKLYTATSYPEIATKIEAFFKGNKTNDTAEPLAEPSKWNPQLSYANFAIACSDSSYRVNDPDDLFPMYQAQYEEASFADVNIDDRLKCAQWRFSAAEPIDFNKLRNVNTSNPILLVNGRYDPVTSLQSAWKVTSKFPGSRLILHEGVGHASLAHPSNCTDNAIRNFFASGEMPKVNTTCSPDMTAFEYGNYQLAEAGVGGDNDDNE